MSGIGVHARYRADTRNPASSFDYLLREPRRARRLRRMNTAGLVALVTVAMALYAFI